MVGYHKLELKTLTEVGVVNGRLGFVLEFLSHATIVGFMGGAATVLCLQQLKGILGLDHFTHGTDIVSVMRSVFTQTRQVFPSSLSHPC